MTPSPRPASAESEIAKERTFGGAGVEIDRAVPVIDLDPGRARDDIDDELWRAAAEVGFFQVANHGIPAEMIDAAFGRAEAFFALPDDVKARWIRPTGSNSGWEFRTQVRPSTGTTDDKESFQITGVDMEPHDLWPGDEEVAGFRAGFEAFERANHELAMRILSSFARRLGFDDDAFARCHDPASPGHQCTVRLLHYLPLGPDGPAEGEWRAGAHTDFDCLTLLHQLPGHAGLQVCPGAEAGDGTAELGWTDVEPRRGVITCNIGDMLMRWSDDRLRSTLHRVRMPRPDEGGGPRYSIAYFAQADREAVIAGPSGAYEPITAGDYLAQRIAANFGGDAAPDGA